MGPGNRPIGFHIGAHVDLGWHCHGGPCILPDSSVRRTPSDALPHLPVRVRARDLRHPARGPSGCADRTNGRPDPRGHLREIRVRTGDVFDEATAQKRVLARLVNAVHWQTREEVVRREIWLQPGEPITAAQAAELERNLRATGLFAEVSVRLLATGRTDEVDLEVTTRDRLSLFLGAGASYVGGVTGLRATVGEGNLLGYGDRLAASFAQNSDGEFRGAAAYTDLHVLDSWHTSTLRLVSTDEGDSIDFDLRRPFKHLADPFGYGFGLRHDNQEVDYYRNGDSLASVSDHRRGIFGDSTWANGPTDRRRFAGFVWNLEQHDYQPATGPLAPEIRVPGDTQSAFAGLQANWAHINGYRKVTGIDTIDYVQDITLGLFFGTTVGARWRHEKMALAAISSPNSPPTHPGPQADRRLVCRSLRARHHALG